jgi:small subunit ribosomal protein S17
MEPTKDGTKAAPIKTAGRTVLMGKVVSDKMDKTIVVAVAKRTLHGLYKKYVQETKKVKAHDENNDAHTGDTVRVVESRPMSKEKHWRLLEIVERAR